MSIASRSTAVERRQFRAAPSIIMSLIKAQAGSLAKAIAECCTNSLDAGATKVDIRLTRDEIVVVDNGKGFKSRKEIEEWFEVFGFEHGADETTTRTYGQFGIGRAQLWAFASTVWNTNGFTMAVDVKAKGLDYDLGTLVKPVRGLEIRGSFYEPVNTRDAQDFERELAALLYYFQIPVSLNGRVVTKDASAEKWTHETPDAWVLVNKSRDVALYNLGMLVCRLPAHKFGVGGVVVTKPGVRFALNMARNAVLESQCAVWKRVKPFLRAQGEEVIRESKAPLSEDELSFQAGEVLSDLDYKLAESAKVFTDVRGRRLSLVALISRLGKRGGALTVAPHKSKIGDLIEGRELGVCLSEETLDRFDVTSLKGLIAKLAESMDRANLDYLAEGLQKCKLYEKVEKFPLGESVDHVVLKDGELDKTEAIALAAVRDVQGALIWALVAPNRYDGDSGDIPPTPRRIVAGQSAASEAWTNGSTYVAVRREGLRAIVRGGLPACVSMITLLVHEYGHGIDTSRTHTHDLEFMEAYHERTCGSTGRGVMETAQLLYRRFLCRCQKADVKLNRSVLDAMALTEDANFTDAPVEPEAQPVKPVKAVKAKPESRPEHTMIAHLKTLRDNDFIAAACDILDLSKRRDEVFARADAMKMASTARMYLINQCRGVVKQFVEA